MKWIILILSCLSCAAQHPLTAGSGVDWTRTSSSAPCTEFGDAIVWVQSSATTITNSELAAAQNLSCSNVFVQVHGNMAYIATGLGSNSTPYLISTNNTAFLGGTNQLFTTNQFTVMITMEVLHQTSQAGYWRGANASITAPAGYSDSPGSSGPVDMVLVGDGAGFLAPAFTDITHWHVWTWIENGASSEIRKDGTTISSGNVGNSIGMGGGTDHTWSLMGFNGSGFISNIEWSRAVIWARPLSDAEAATYEAQCAKDYF